MTALFYILKNMSVENFIPKEFKERKDFVFKLCTPLKQRSFYIQLDEIIYEPETNHNVRMKVIDGSTTIFYDKLSEAEKARKPKEVCFEFNKLRVSSKDQSILNALFMSDNFIGKEKRNSSNSISNQLFYLEDIELEANNELKSLEEELIAYNMASNATDEEIEMMAAVIGISMPKEFWRPRVIKYAKENPKLFKKEFSSDYTKALYIVKKGFDSGILGLDSNKYAIVWANTNKPILDMPKDKFEQTKTLYSFFANYLLSSEGKAASDTLKKFIDNVESSDTIENEYTNSDFLEQRKRGRPAKAE